MAIVDPRTDPRWDELIAGLPNPTAFHSQGWCHLLSDTYSFNPAYIVTRDGTRVTGLLPMMEVTDWRGRKRGVSLPFTDSAPALVGTADARQKLREIVDSESIRRRWNSVEYRGEVTLWEQASVATSFYQHALELTAGPLALRRRFHGSTRTALNKAESGKLQVVWSQGEHELKDFYALLCLTRKRLGVPPQPFSFYRNLRRHVLEKNGGWIVIVRSGPKAVAGAIFLVFKGTAIFKFGASNADYQHLRANNLVIWNAIERFATSGMKVLDFGRTSLSNEGLRRFKLGWGGVERKLDYLRYLPNRQEFVTCSDRSKGWYTHLFRHLPAPISRAIGTFLYRYTA